jgi:hypothetical protein
MKRETATTKEDTMENKMSYTMQAELKETFSPQAVALIIAHLQCCDGNATAHREVAWFRNQLVALVGGAEAASELFEEVGV